MHNRRRYYIFLFIVLQVVYCKKPYEPAVLKAANNYLVVDGLINIGAGGITTISLSRTKNLTDTVVSIPELHAAVSIQDAGGASYPLQESGADGTYTSRSLNLDRNSKYRLVITTSNRARYQSEPVSGKVTPPVDSITWQQPDNINLYVYTHDVNNSVRFYRWQYVETWEYHSAYDSPYGVANGLIYVRDTSNFVHICYNSRNSTSIILGTSAALSQDVISAAPLAIIPRNDARMEYRYSILVKEYAMLPEAYYYWQIIQKNSQQLGTLFDLQPSQLVGNIHSVTNPAEPVVGFVSAGTEQQKRIFINRLELFNWKIPPSNDYCPVLDIAQNPGNFAIFDYFDPSFVPWYFTSGGGLKISKKECIDCTLKGGTNHKPSFW